MTGVMEGGKKTVIWQNQEVKDLSEKSSL